MSADKIKAGKAEVELSLRDNFDRGLSVAKKKLLAFADGVRRIGTYMTAAGGAVIAAYGGLATKALGFAGQLKDISESTGISAESLSALSFAANQAGVPLEMLNGGLRTMAKFAYMVQAGGKGANETLGRLGISAQAFLAATPEERLALIAEGLQQINDPAERAALAMKIFGKSGFDMQRMLAGGAAGLNESLALARQMGAVVSDQEVSLLDKLGDSWTAIGDALKGFAVHVAAALAPALQTATDYIMTIIGVVNEFVVQNQTLVAWIAAVASVVTLAGAALISFAGVIATVGMIAGGLSSALTAATTVFTTLGTVAAFMISPMGIVVASLAAIAAAAAVGAAYFLFFTEAGRGMCAALVAGLMEVWKIASLTFGGILDYLVAGNWAAAGAMAMQALKIAWAFGTGELDNLWTGFVVGMQDRILGAMRYVLDVIKSTITAAVGVLNQALAKLQLPQINGGKLTKALDKVDAGLAGRQKAGRDAQAAKEAANAANVRSLVDGLEKMREDARKEREAAQARLVATTPKVNVPNLPANKDFPGAQTGTGTLGTFSGYVAELLGRSAPDIKPLKAIEKNTQRSADIEEDIRDRLDEMDGGLFAVGG